MRQKRWEWENIQVRLFKVRISSLTLEQVQGTGSSFINELKNILITFWAAKEVVDGSMTLGMMMAGGTAKHLREVLFLFATNVPLK
jgi:ATP-binding cassette, subfamily B, bacterial